MLTHVLLRSVGFLSIILQNLGYPSKLGCDRSMLPGAVIMSNTVKPDSSRSVVAKRNGVVLASGAQYVPGENLTIDISTIYTPTGAFKFIFEVSGAMFVNNITCATRCVECNNRRAYNLGDGTTGDFLLQMPPLSGKIVQVWVAFAEQYGKVYVSNNFTLLGFPSTQSPTLSPDTQTLSPTVRPSKSPSTTEAPVGNTVTMPISQVEADSYHQNFTLVLRRELVNGKNLITVNHTSPGPTLRVKLNQWVRVKVINEMGDDMGTMHWHGMDMHKTQYNDGVPGITQCLINTLTSTGYYSNTNQVTILEYVFKPDRVGTFWYHGHYNEQYVDGQYGALIVEDDNATTSSYAQKGVSYGYETELMLADWYQSPAKQLSAAYLSPSSLGNEPVPDAIVVNNVFTEGMVIIVDRTAPLRVRVINAAALSMFTISVDGMPLTLIEVDGIPVVPQDFAELTLNVAQRVSFILDWSRIDSALVSLSSIVFRVRLTPQMYRQYDDTDLDAYGLFGSTSGTKLLRQWKGVFQFSGSTFANDDGSYYSYGTSPSLIPPSTYPVPVDADILEAKMLYPAPIPPPDLMVWYNITFKTNAGGVRMAYINGDTYATPDVQRPMLYDYMSQNGGPLQENASYPSRSFISGSGAQPFVLPFNRTIDILINNGDGGEHPIHLHGHNFWIISTSKYPDTSKNALQRDVVSVPAVGWARIRFLSDNPGVWLIHCHIDWHVSAGFVAVVLEAPSKLKNTLSTVPKGHKDACPVYFGNTAVPTTSPSFNPAYVSPAPTSFVQSTNTPTTSRAPVSQSFQPDWTTYGFDQRRTGLNPYETSIAANNFDTLVEVWRVPLPAAVLAQVLVVLNYRMTPTPVRRQMAQRIQETTSIPTRIPTFSPSVKATIAPSVQPTRPTVSPALTGAPQKTIGFCPIYNGMQVQCGGCQLCAQGEVCNTCLNSPTLAPTRTPTFTPSRISTVPISSAPLLTTGIPTTPSVSPSRLPTTTVPTLIPTRIPSHVPSSSPPTTSPTLTPSSEIPSVQPTKVWPSSRPSNMPSLQTKFPSMPPTLFYAIPSTAPSAMPTNPPSLVPSTATPSGVPIQPGAPTQKPTASPALTNAPNRGPGWCPVYNGVQTGCSGCQFCPGAILICNLCTAPSVVPSVSPIRLPSSLPILSPVAIPSLLPTASPSNLPTLIPSTQPSLVPAIIPSLVPVVAPTNFPSLIPTVSPSRIPNPVPSSPPASQSSNPSYVPSIAPSVKTSTTPTGIPVAPSGISAAPSRKPTSSPALTGAPNKVSGWCPIYNGGQVGCLGCQVCPDGSRCGLCVPTAVPTTFNPAYSARPTSSPVVTPTRIPSDAPVAVQSSSPTLLIPPSPSPTTEKGYYNVGYVGDENGNFVAIDLDVGAILWQVNLGWGTYCGKIPNSAFGISSTAELNRTANSVYTFGGDGAFYALSMRTGAILWSIGAVFDPSLYVSYSALLLHNQRIYAPLASHCDLGKYKGGVIGINTATRLIESRFFPAGPTVGGGIWSVGGVSLGTALSLANDETPLYVSTGNCVGENSYYCETMVKLDKYLNVTGYYKPSLTVFGLSDNDFGSTTTIINGDDEERTSGCPKTLVTGTRKDGILYVTDTDMNIIQTIQVGDPTGYEFYPHGAWDPSVNVFLIPLKVAWSTYVRSFIGYELGSDCQLHEIYRTPFAGSANFFTLTVVGPPGQRVAINSGGSLAVIEMATGRVVAALPTSIPSVASPTVINHLILVSEYIAPGGVQAYTIASSPTRLPTKNPV